MLPVHPVIWVHFPAGQVKYFHFTTMALTANSPSYNSSALISLHVIPVPRNSERNFKLEGVYVTGYRYMIHFYCLAVEAGFYSEVVECLSVDPVTWVRFQAGTGEIFSLYDKNTIHLLYDQFLWTLNIALQRHCTGQPFLQ